MCHRKTEGWAFREKKGKGKQMEKVIVNKRSQLNELEKGSAITWIGLAIDDESLAQLFGWIKCHTPVKVERVFIVSGSLMNMAYGLKGDFAYSEDLNIVSVKLCDLEKPMKIVPPRAQAGAHWFDDIVDRDRRRVEDDDGE